MASTSGDAEESGTTELHRVLDVEQLESDLFRGTVTPRSLASLATIYGGHLVGQGLVAAARTVPARRRPHSMQTYFLRPGRPGEQIEYRVRLTRDGATLSRRAVDVYQRRQQIAQISASFADQLDGVDHQTPMPEAPAPETMPALAELVQSDPEGWPPLYHAWTLFDVRYAAAPRDRQARPGHAPPGHAQVWLRAAQPVSGDATWHACALAYASDLTLLSATLPVQSLRPGMPGLAMASLDHVLWFHRACSVSDWLLYDQFVPSTSGGLSLARGRLFSRNGTLVASVMQEGMVRMIDPASSGGPRAPGPDPRPSSSIGA
jgi:acyl-CoA thioesterase-2